MFRCRLCQLLDTLGDRHTFQDKTPPVPSGIGLQISGKDSLSTGAWCVEEEQEIKQLGQSSSTFVGLCARQASVPLPTDDHICDSSRNWDPTKPGGSPHHVSGAKAP